MPYVYNLSHDVEKCTLYLVLSHCTRTNAVQATAVASRGCENRDRLPVEPLTIGMLVHSFTMRGHTDLV